MPDQRSHRCPCGKTLKTSSAIAQHQADSMSHHGPKAHEKLKSQESAITQVFQQACRSSRDDVPYVPFTDSVNRSSRPASCRQPVKFVEAKSVQAFNEKKRKQKRQKLEQANALASSSKANDSNKDMCEEECGWCSGCLDTRERWAETVDDAADLR